VSEIKHRTVETNGIHMHIAECGAGPVVVPCHKLVFFEIFSSSAAHQFHLEQDYMKRLFAALEGKLAGATIMTKLNAL
jgi:hypothetical protein